MTRREERRAAPPGSSEGNNMNKMIRTAIFVLLAVELTSRAAEVSAGAEIASAYVFRGVTLNDGPVLQPSIEISGMPVTFGVWGNFNLSDYEGNAAENEFSEIDLYGSFDIPLGLDPFGLSAGYTEYAYPGGSADADREIWLSAAADVLLRPFATLFYGLDGAIARGFYAECGIGHSFTLPAGVSLNIRTSLAFSSPDEGPDGFSHWTAGAVLGWKILSAGITCIEQIDDEVLPDGKQAYDADIVATVGISHTF